MPLFKRLLAGVGAEFRAIFGVMPLLRRPFWIAWGLCFLPALVALVPGRWAVVAQLFVLIGLGLAGLFSGTLAKRVRRRKWVEFPDGPEVAPYLPQLITLLAGPAYCVAMVVLFLRAALAFPGLLPTAGLLDALRLALDNFVRTQVFFGAAECFHLRFDGRAEGLAGASLVFVSRFLMDLVFIKLAVQILNAAYFRAQGLGRGEDLLFTVKQEIEAADVPRVKELCQQVGDSLRDAVDTLCRTYEAGGDRAAMAWRCLVTMRGYAIPYLKTRHRAATGDERERIAQADRPPGKRAGGRRAAAPDATSPADRAGGCPGAWRGRVIRAVRRGGTGRRGVADGAGVMDAGRLAGLDRPAGALACPRAVDASPARAASTALGVVRAAIAGRRAGRDSFSSSLAPPLAYSAARQSEK